MSVLVKHRKRLCKLALYAALWYALPASAQTAASAIELEWRAPSGCPDRNALLRKLDERLSQRRPAVALRAHARVVRSGAVYRLELELVSPGARATRQLSDAQCAPLVEAEAVLIALATQNEAAETSPAPTQPAPTEPARQPEPAGTVSAPTATPASGKTTLAPAVTARLPKRVPEAEPETEPEPIERPANPLRWQLSAAARAGLGTFPHRPAPAVQAQLAVRSVPMYVALGLSYWPGFEQTSSSYPGARLRGSGIFSDLSLGLDMGTRPILLSVGLDVELGQLTAQGQGIAGPQSDRSLWLAAGPSTAIGVSILNDWTLALDLAGLAPVYRSHWLVRTPTGDVSAFVAARVSWRLSLRLSYVLPL